MKTNDDMGRNEAWAAALIREKAMLAEPGDGDGRARRTATTNLAE
ncbi:hypothetical protein [Paenibacillus sabuli]|nr:hypothetical protein [Paenibacillus sabuli]